MLYLLFYTIMSLNNLLGVILSQIGCAIYLRLIILINRHIM